jgi:hypothetical protein
MIKVAFTASHTLFGRLIRYMSRGRVSHCIIQYPDALWGGEWVAEATFPTVRMVPAEKSRHSIVEEFECLFDAPAAFKKIRMEIGKSYDFLLIADMSILLLLWRFLGYKMKHPFAGSGGDVCSELVVKFFQAAKLDESSQLNPNTATPQQLMEYCIKHPNHFKLIT